MTVLIPIVEPKTATEALYAAKEYWNQLYSDRLRTAAQSALNCVSFDRERLGDMMVYVYTDEHRASAWVFNGTIRTEVEMLTDKDRDGLCAVAVSSKRPQGVKQTDIWLTGMNPHQARLLFAALQYNMVAILLGDGGQPVGESS